MISKNVSSMNAGSANLIGSNDAAYSSHMSPTSRMNMSQNSSQKQISPEEKMNLEKFYEQFEQMSKGKDTKATKQFL